MTEFIRKCIHDHRNPMVKITLPARKLFFKAKDKEEETIVRDEVKYYKTVLEHQRVERRSKRAQAVWLADCHMAKITKSMKNVVKYFGYQNKTGIFIYPEEMLVLLEINKLEVTFNDSSLSLEEAYDIVLNTCNMSLPRYQIYKRLILLGYKVTRREQIELKLLKNENMLESTDENLGPAIKKRRLCTSKDHSEHIETKKMKELEYINNIFNTMIHRSPKMSTSLQNNSLKPDYLVFMPLNVGKTIADFSLFIIEGPIVDVQPFSSELPCVFATYLEDVAFYKFSEAFLPCNPF